VRKHKHPKERPKQKRQAKVTLQRAAPTGHPIRVKGTRQNGKQKFCVPLKNGQAYVALPPLEPAISQDVLKLDEL